VPSKQSYPRDPAGQARAPPHPGYHHHPDRIYLQPAANKVSPLRRGATSWQLAHQTFRWLTPRSPPQIVPSAPLGAPISPGDGESDGETPRRHHGDSTATQPSAPRWRVPQPVRVQPLSLTKPRKKGLSNSHSRYPQALLYPPSPWPAIKRDGAIFWGT